MQQVGLHSGSCADRASGTHELFLSAQPTREHQQQHHIIAMASVYKTLSGTDKDQEKTGEKRNKQRVLILVHIGLCKEKVRVPTNVTRAQEVLHSDTDICCKICTR